MKYIIFLIIGLASFAFAEEILATETEAQIKESIDTVKVSRTSVAMEFDSLRAECRQFVSDANSMLEQMDAILATVDAALESDPDKEINADRNSHLKMLVYQELDPNTVEEFRMNVAFLHAVLSIFDSMYGTVDLESEFVQ